jgi:hypothetical protein
VHACLFVCSHGGRRHALSSTDGPNHQIASSHRSLIRVRTMYICIYVYMRATLMDTSVDEDLREKVEFSSIIYFFAGSPRNLQLPNRLV